HVARAHAAAEELDANFPFARFGHRNVHDFDPTRLDDLCGFHRVTTVARAGMFAFCHSTSFFSPTAGVTVGAQPVARVKRRWSLTYHRWSPHRHSPKRVSMRCPTTF